MEINGLIGVQHFLLKIGHVRCKKFVVLRRFQKCKHTLVTMLREKIFLHI
jgi:hypothetical protein